MNASPKKRLKNCLKALSDQVLNDFRDTLINGIAYDSRKVNPGDVFFALVGAQFDGHQFIDSAVGRGAKAVVGTQPAITLDVPYVQIEGDDRLALAKFSAAFYDDPSQDLVVIGITGTDGKTTTTNLVYHILKTAGIPVGMISSVNAVVGNETLDTGFHVTTPESPDIQGYLAQMREAGLTHVILETTSHGLAQKRVAEVAYDMAAVTNVTHEHLDYHRTYQAYLQAKGLLFEALNQGQKSTQSVDKLAVLNKEDESYPYLAKITEVRKISYGFSDTSDLWASDIAHSPKGLSFLVHGFGKSFAIQTPLIGRYNVLNSLAALGLTVYGMDVAVQIAQEALKTMTTVPGRMERVDMGQDFLALVDFAHTPNAIKQALKTAREITAGKIIAVFGSAGLRDVEKRKLMPEIAVSLADEVILTAEDPRTEALDLILRDMREGALQGGGQEGSDFWLEPDRGSAIRQAVGRAEAGDLVILCGKGHEQSMCFGIVEYPWDDRTALRAALAETLGLPSPAMPQLPTSPDG